MKNLILALFATTLLVACSNDDDMAAPLQPENTIASAISQANLVTQGVGGTVTTPKVKRGFEFTPSKDGNLTHLGFLINQTVAGTVEIWDNDSSTLIHSEVITGSNNQEATMAITPIALSANKKYVLVVTSRFWEAFSESNNADIFPIDAGSISISGYRWINSDSGFPSSYNSNLQFLAGIPTFTFIPNN